MVFEADPVAIEKIIVIQRSQFHISCSKQELQVRNVVSPLQLLGKEVLKFAEIFAEQMEKGLQYNRSSSFSMQNTFVYNTLGGTEEGQFLGLDLGGTNFRVILVKISYGHLVEEDVGKYEVSEELKRGSCQALFDFIAECLFHFTEKHGVTSDNLPLGFTFSFPVDQTSLDSGSVTAWVGQYNIPDAIGKDVVNLLKESIARINKLKVNIVALINDTTGVLIRGSLIDKDTMISLILGTGSNACYFEKTNKMAGWTGPEKEAVINIEWACLPDKGLVDFIKTKFDEEIDATSLYPGSFMLEKFIGGEYFGELARLIICDMVNKGILFGGCLSEKLQQQKSFSSSYISSIEKDNLEKDTHRTEEVLTRIGVDRYTIDDIKIVKFVCEEISIRLALLTSACLAPIVKRIDRHRVTVAVDGSLYKYHPRLHHYITEFTRVLVGKEKEVKLILAEDGSGTGAALVAAMASIRNP